MARVTCAWEFGGGLGHVRRLCAIGAELRQRGHEVAFTFREPALLDTPHKRGFAVFAAPRLSESPQRDLPPLNFSDVLLKQGFDDAPGLKSAIRAWRSLFGLLETELLVADYAPTALLAARAMDLRRVTVGSGFSLPPPGEPDPALRPWEAVKEEHLRALDARLALSMREALGPDAPVLPARIFDAHAHLLCTFADLDPFGARANAGYVGPVGEDAAGRLEPWSGDARPRVFAYLNPEDTRLPELIAALRELAGEAIVVAPGANAVSAGSVRIVGEPVRLEGLLEEADLCISHGNPGIGARALAAGVPLAMLPMQLEHYLIARRLKDSGTGEVFDHAAPAAQIKGWLRAILARDDLRAAARARADALSGFSFAGAAAVAATRIELAAGA